MKTTKEKLQESIEVIGDLTKKCLDHPNAKGHPIWHAGLWQALTFHQELINGMESDNNE